MFSPWAHPLLFLHLFIPISSPNITLHILDLVSQCASRTAFLLPLAYPRLELKRFLRLLLLLMEAEVGSILRFVNLSKLDARIVQLRRE